MSVAMFRPRSAPAGRNTVVVIAGLLAAAAAVLLLRRTPTPPALIVQGGPSPLQVRQAQAEVDAHPQDADLKLRLARLHLERAEPEAAIPLLVSAAKDPKTALEATQAMQECGRRFGRQDELLPGFQAAVAAAPREPRTWAALVRDLDAIGRSGPARAALDEALRRFPQAPSLQIARGAYLAQHEEPLEGVKAYRLGLAKQPDAAAQLELALLLARLNSAREAKEAFRKALDLDPTSVLAYLGLAKANLELGLPGEAEHSAYAALQVAPEDPEAMFILARVLMDRGPEDMRTARELLERVLRLRPQHQEARYHLALVKLRAGDAKGAIPDFEAIIEKQPYRLEARQNYATALQQAGDTQAAALQQKASTEIAQVESRRQALMNRVSVSPQDPNLRCELGEFYLEHRALQLAEREFGRALELDPASERAKSGLAKARGATP